MSLKQEFLQIIYAREGLNHEKGLSQLHESMMFFLYDKAPPMKSKIAPTTISTTDDK